MEETYYLYLHRCNAEVAQLVELQPSKLVVASSSLVFRSEPQMKVWGFLFYGVPAERNSLQTRNIRSPSCFRLYLVIAKVTRGKLLNV